MCLDRMIMLKYMISEKCKASGDNRIFENKSIMLPPQSACDANSAK